MFNRKPRNEKWETIRKRELRNDIVGTVILVPMFYILTVMTFCLQEKNEAVGLLPDDFSSAKENFIVPEDTKKLIRYNWVMHSSRL